MEWLNYHHLRYFWIAAKEGSLTKAAAKLHVSQPSISEQIRELESLLDEKLFRRENLFGITEHQLAGVGQDIVAAFASEKFLIQQ